MDETRRYRGLVRTSLTAGIVMSAIATGALVIGSVTGLVPSSIFGVRELMAVAIRGFGAGAVAGGLFAWFISRGARGEVLSAISSRRVALWGGLATGSVFLLAGLAAPGIVPITVLGTAIALAGVGGGAVSAGMLRLARRAPQQLEELDESPGCLLP
jgi:hypothetical protein